MGLSQSCKPKHQVLITKCYPKYTKSRNDVKPNSSELSYLLYYCSTRRSKLQKVGAFLEKRTIADVRKARQGNVQVTLQIVTALIEKCPRDLALYSSYILNIFSTILKSGDLNYIEESVPAFGSFCGHVDHAAFTAEPLQTKQYHDIIKTYASFASRPSTPQVSVKSKRGLPEQLRLWTAGLKALQSLVSSSTFSTGQEDMKIVVPTLLDQLASKDPSYISRLEQRERAKGSFEKEQAHRRRPSLAAHRSMEMPRTPRLTASSEADPIAAVGTTADVDMKATEELGVLALQTLRTMFGTDNRGQIRTATALAIYHTVGRPTKSDETSEKIPFHTSSASSWLTELFDRICSWTPVQDRFIVLVTMVESLTNTSDDSHTSSRQYQLAPAVTHLLRSDYNFIGLSVLDVLLAILEIMRAGGSDVFLAQLRDCVGALASHIYYGDQISDMVAAIVQRLPGEISNSCVQEVLEVSRTELQNLRLPPPVRAELGLETADANSVQLSKTGSKSSSASRLRRARERELQLRSAQLDEAPSLDQSSHKSVLGVDDLKRALSGVFVPARPLSSIDTASDSMVSGEFSASEVSLPLNGHWSGNAQGSVNGIAHGTFPAIAVPSQPTLREGERLSHDTPPLDFDVPPVPALPQGLGY